MKPARLLMTTNRAMRTTTWLRIGALCMGANTMRSLSTPPANEIAMVDRLIDHHDGERHAGVDAAGRQPRQHLVQEDVHAAVLLVAEVGAPDIFVLADLA